MYLSAEEAAGKTGRPTRRLLPINEAEVPSGFETLLRRLGLRRHRRADALGSLPHYLELLAPVRRRVDQFLNVDGPARPIRRPDFAQQRLKLREHADVFAVGLGKHL